MEYTITIKETLERHVKIDAPDYNTAVDIAERMYDAGEIVLDYTDLVDVEIS